MPAYFAHGLLICDHCPIQLITSVPSTAPLLYQYESLVPMQPGFALSCQLPHVFSGLKRVPILSKFPLCHHFSSLSLTQPSLPSNFLWWPFWASSAHAFIWYIFIDAYCVPDTLLDMGTYLWIERQKDLPSLNPHSNLPWFFLALESTELGVNSRLTTPLACRDYNRPLWMSPVCKPSLWLTVIASWQQRPCFPLLGIS